MQSGTPPTPSEEPPLYTMANLIGTVIALITLASPVYIINHFSSSGLPTPQNPTLDEPIAPSMSPPMLKPAVKPMDKSVVKSMVPSMVPSRP
jgi:hypothetical protein